MANNQYVNKVVKGNTTLIDLTSDTVTTNSLMQGYTAHDKSGAPIVGTATGGGTEAGTVTQDANGYLVLDDDPPAGPSLITKSITQNGTYNASSDSADGYSSVTVNVSGGGGLVYETGTYTPAEDVAQPTISFSGNHANRPAFVLLSDTTNTVESAGTNLYFTVVNWYDCYGVPLLGTDTTMYYARVQYGYKISTGMTQSGNAINQYDPNIPVTASVNYYLDASWFKPYTGSTSRYWRAGTTYKWIAVWAPTS